MAADPSPWPSVISASVTGVLTGGALLVQTWMTTKRDGKRLEAEALADENNRRHALADRQSESLFKARSDWMAAFHSYYVLVRHGLRLMKFPETQVPEAVEYNKAQRAGAELLLQRTSTLLLIEKTPVNRRLIHVLTLLITVDRNSDDPTLDDRLGDLFMAFLTFGNVLAGVDANIDAVVKKITDLDPTLAASIDKFVRS
jgi:hypothetical protein